jgi:hypothetical protein
MFNKKKYVSKKSYSCKSPPRSKGYEIDYNPNANSTFGSGVRNRQLKKQYEDLKGAEYDDYNSLVQYMSLESDVFTSHDSYTREMDRTTTGPSNMAERSDPNDTVPWIGLRRINYNVPMSSNIRTEPTETSDQMYEQTNYSL